MPAIALPQARVPDGVRVYAVGDLHGRHDLLLQLFEKIEADAAKAPEPHKELIFLGDYIDRGLHVRQTLEWLMGFSARPEGKKYRLTCLRGNHEAMLLNFLRNPAHGQTWLENGANETFLSFGIKLSSLHPRAETFQHLAEQLHGKLAGNHLEFLSKRPLMGDGVGPAPSRISRQRSSKQTNRRFRCRSIGDGWAVRLNDCFRE